MSVVARLDDGPFDPALELGALVADAAGAGAVVSFTGLTRPSSREGADLAKLVLEHHPRLTARSIEEIAEQGRKRFDVSHVRVVHRCGALSPGEPIVFAGAAARHRRAAFECADYLMDRLKTEALFWKREEGPAGTSWIEPTEQDYAERGRWE